MTLGRKSLIMIIIVIIIGIIPLFMNHTAEFGGADGEAEGVISQINPSYQPWINSIWEPPSGEIESLLFVLQGVLGAGFLGYYIGLKKGQAKASGK